MPKIPLNNEVPDVEDEINRKVTEALRDLYYDRTGDVIDDRFYMFGLKLISDMARGLCSEEMIEALDEEYLGAQERLSNTVDVTCLVKNDSEGLLIAADAKKGLLSLHPVKLLKGVKNLDFSEDLEPHVKVRERILQVCESLNWKNLSL